MLFRQRILEGVKAVNHPICIGIDPDSPPLHSFLHGESVRLEAESYLYRLVESIVESADSQCRFVKFQSAFFEAYGEKGLRALKRGMALARANGFFCILDAKRGDISSTMAAYGRSAFDYLEADALTVTPYMGWDVIEPLLPWLKKSRGIFIVWLTSNASAAETQDLFLREPSKSKHFLSHVAQTLVHHAKTHQAEEAIGFVVGATRLEKHVDLLSSMSPEQSFLLPGVGAQGGSFSPALRNLVRENPASLIPISRGIVDQSVRCKTWAEFGAVTRDNLQRYIDEWNSPTKSNEAI